MTNQDKKNLILLSNRFTVTVKLNEVKFIEIVNANPASITLQDKGQMLGHTYFSVDNQSLARIGVTVAEFRTWLLEHGATKKKREKRVPMVSIYD
jgi:hypothetical protein